MFWEGGRAVTVHGIYRRIGCTRKWLGCIHVCMHIKAPAVLLPSSWGWINSIPVKLLPAACVLRTPPPSPYSLREMISSESCVKYETAAAGSQERETCKKKKKKKGKGGNKKQKMIIWDLAGGRCHVRPRPPKNDDTATESDTSLLTQVLTSRLMLCNHRAFQRSSSSPSATARGLTGPRERNSPQNASLTTTYA